MRHSDSSTASSDAAKNTRTAIAVGRYTLISSGATLHPPHRFVRNPDTNVVEPTYYAQKIGENVFVGRDSYVAAAQVGNHVWIGEGAVIENGCVIRDCVKVLPGSVMPAGMVAGVGSVVGRSLFPLSLDCFSYFLALFFTFQGNKEVRGKMRG